MPHVVRQPEESPLAEFRAGAAFAGGGMVALDCDDVLGGPGTWMVGQRARVALERLSRSRWLLVLVTDLPLRFARKWMMLNGVTGTAICCGGGVTYDVSHDRVLRQQTMTQREVESVIDDLRVAGPRVAIGWEAGRVYGCEIASPLARWFAGGLLTVDAKAAARQVVALLVSTEPISIVEPAMNVGAVASGKVTARRYCSHWLGFLAAEVSKSAATAQLADNLGIERQWVLAIRAVAPQEAPSEWSAWGFTVAVPQAIQGPPEDPTGGDPMDGVAQVLERLLTAP